MRPSTGYPVRAFHPDAVTPEPLEGYVWLLVDGRLRHVWAERLELSTSTEAEEESH